MAKKILFVGLAVLLIAGMVIGGARAGGLRKVVGSGHLIDDNGIMRTATVAAIELPNGTAIGEAEAVLHTDPVTVAHIGVTCIRFFEYDGAKAAVVSGPLEKVINAPIPPGDYEIITLMVDYGKGLEEMDIMSRGVVVPASYGLNCTNFTPTEWTLIEFGSIQISD
jgi:hypothetical protein